MPSALLADRRLIRVSGTGAEEFLNNLITTDVENLPEGEARASALLTPQGKILFDFLISRDGTDFLIETGAAEQETLLRRLTMYKLRAPVDLKPETVEGVSVFWNETAPEAGVRDSRFAKADVDLFRVAGASASGDAAAYDALRIEHGIAESVRDYALQDAFPHDVLMDVNDGVSFKKGCFVGQEVVSRMKHRGTARRRVVTVSAEGALPASGTEITADGKPVGTLGTVCGDRALAIVRIDRIADALASGTPLLAATVPVTVALPAWSGLSFPAADPAARAED
ncbi:MULTISPECIES: folate-binding protein YgfZ [unclassified Agrobacterium]|uniref:CAF17-like 4Fe-4S cluster assembly/insertion protein YgfZ n=1 Tax=unclassified Agrobacterium TaxID=2632611 RepID=UPI0024480C97|nr:MULTISPECIES: folate-binding protein YgfZ [unclassified Agrobacterium]MDH0614540.1 folate-binding protein YgfZ [Agrobacterium sp. GD03872]MDH0695165.1 folate-binding protein YgfZ [Agrobacterium sp. GD03871]MDH1058067.1 folate-binding protein YgfZ [Agrobacterium sp. GD03992]MDH2213897.1 folate-binding protein YgfZ [Agrobacterium sp. GD03643]MDH2222749.1 folate-binding protein YgfZ [Agrobacterium sp. GD03638]